MTKIIKIKMITELKLSSLIMFVCVPMVYSLITFLASNIYTLIYSENSPNGHLPIADVFSGTGTFSLLF